MIRSLVIAAALLAIPVTANADVNEAVDLSAQYLISRWTADPTLNEYRPPQVLPVVAKSKIYGACGSQIRGHELGGSSYCPATHTVYLVPEELELFHDAFGASSVTYVISHEFGHALQMVLEAGLTGPSEELQADCLAGILIKEGSKQLGITRDDVIGMAQAAYAIGSESHGSGAQRAYALFSGMGVSKSSCTASEMTALAQGKVNDPMLVELNKQRSGTVGIDTSITPYPKTVKGALGL